MSSLPERNKDVISPDSRIRKGVRPKTDSNCYIYKLLASWSCPELNLINIPIHFQRCFLISENEKLGVRERVDPSSMEMMIFIY